MTVYADNHFPIKLHQAVNSLAVESLYVHSHDKQQVGGRSRTKQEDKAC